MRVMSCLRWTALIGLTVASTFTAAQTSPGCWFPLTVEVVGKAPAVERISGKNLDVKVKGKPTSISSLQLRHASQAIVLLDSSGSMHSAGWKNAILLARDLVDGTPSEVQRVGLMTFGKMENYARGRDNSQKLLADVSASGPYGRTGLYDAMLSAVRYYEAGPETIMFLITDAGDNHSRSELRDARRELIKSGVRVVVLLTASATDKPGTVEEMLGPLNASDLTDSSGGIVLKVDLANREYPDHVLQPNAVQKLLEFYRVEIPYAEGNLKVRLLDSSGKKAKDMAVHYPSAVVNCETK